MKRPDELDRTIDFTHISKVSGVPYEQNIRLYSAQSHSQWNLQVRGPMRLANGRDGKDFIVATASLSLDDLRALRDAIVAQIKYTEKETK